MEKLLAYISCKGDFEISSIREFQEYVTENLKTLNKNIPKLTMKKKIITTYQSEVGIYMSMQENRHLASDRFDIMFYILVILK